MSEDKLAAFSSILADMRRDVEQQQDRANERGDVGMRQFYQGRENAISEVQSLLRLAGLAPKETDE